MGMAEAPAEVPAAAPAAPPPDVLTPAQALEEILGRVRQLPDEPAAVGPDLAGRVLAADAVAAVSLPPFATSAMDGYAVRAAELGDGPIPVAFRIAAGDRPRALPSGAVAGIATGAPIPDGADSVVPIEDATESDGGMAADRPRVGDAVRPAGSDIVAGQVVVAAGSILGPAALAALAAAGVASVQVSAQPRLAALATGDELRAPGEPLEPGQIYESNLTSVAAQALRSSARVVRSVTVHDDRAATVEAFAEALAEADVVVSTGGVSVGPHDHVKPALEECGVEQVFWRIAHKPGKPLWFGVGKAGQLVFGLPGNPVSSLVTFELFVRPALFAMQGATPPARTVGRLATAVQRLRNRDHAMRCMLQPGPEGMLLVPQEAQDSHLIAHAAAADVVAIVPAGEGQEPAGSLLEYVVI
jgi:molybdopterin molybdotransferase